MWTSLGCTDTPFLASCRCRTRVGHRNGYDSPDSSGRWVSFFFFFSFLQHAPTRLRHSFDTSDMPAVKKKKNHRFWVWEIILRNPPLKFSTHPPSDLCRCPLFLTGARSRRSASSIDIEWRRALSLPAISLSRCGQQVRPPLSVFFFLSFLRILILVTEW